MRIVLQNTRGQENKYIFTRDNYFKRACIGIRRQTENDDDDDVLYRPIVKPINFTRYTEPVDYRMTTRISDRAEWRF